MSVLCVPLTNACTQVVTRTIGSIPLNLSQLSEKDYILVTALRTPLTISPFGAYANSWSDCEIHVNNFSKHSTYESDDQKNLRRLLRGKINQLKDMIPKQKLQSTKVGYIYIQEIHYEKVYEAIKQRAVSYMFDHSHNAELIWSQHNMNFQFIQVLH